MSCHPYARFPREDRRRTFRHPSDSGSDGGGGAGGGWHLGRRSVGVEGFRLASALLIAVCGDGDFLMGVTAVWTAVHYKISLLFVIANNRSFYNDELHQERVARMRDRPVENKWIGQRMADPEIDIAAMGRREARSDRPDHEYRRPGALALEKLIAAVDAGKRRRRQSCARRAGGDRDRRDDPF